MIWLPGALLPWIALHPHLCSKIRISVACRLLAQCAISSFCCFAFATWAFTSNVIVSSSAYAKAAYFEFVKLIYCVFGSCFYHCE